MNEGNNISPKTISTLRLSLKMLVILVSIGGFFVLYTNYTVKRLPFLSGLDFAFSAFALILVSLAAAGFIKKFLVKQNVEDLLIEGTKMSVVFSDGKDVELLISQIVKIKHNWFDWQLLIVALNQNQKREVIVVNGINRKQYKTICQQIDAGK